MSVYSNESMNTDAGTDCVFTSSVTTLFSPFLPFFFFFLNQLHLNAID